MYAAFTCKSMTYISWTMPVVHSRDYKEVGVAHETTQPTNQTQSQMTMGQYWLAQPNFQPSKSYYDFF